jgi:hypothetical protein
VKFANQRGQKQIEEMHVILNERPKMKKRRYTYYKRLKLLWKEKQRYHKRKNRKSVNKGET